MSPWAWEAWEDDFELTFSDVRPAPSGRGSAFSPKARHLSGARSLMQVRGTHKTLPGRSSRQSLGSPAGSPTGKLGSLSLSEIRSPAVGEASRVARPQSAAASRLQREQHASGRVLQRRPATAGARKSTAMRAQFEQIKTPGGGRMSAAAKDRATQRKLRKLRRFQSKAPTMQDLEAHALASCVLQRAAAFLSPAASPTMPSVACTERAVAQVRCAATWQAGQWWAHRHRGASVGLAALQTRHTGRARECRGERRQPTGRDGFRESDGKGVSKQRTRSAPQAVQEGRRNWRRPRELRRVPRVHAGPRDAAVGREVFAGRRAVSGFGRCLSLPDHRLSLTFSLPFLDLRAFP